MKIIIPLAISLLFTLCLSAKEISSNSTLKQYAKPGAAINMNYSSQRVDINEFSDVNITLTTTIPKGTVLVEVNLDKKLSALSDFEKNLMFPVSSRNEDFIIKLQVKSEQVGLYYIRLLVKVDEGYGVKLRSFAIPIYVGEEKEIKKNRANIQMKAFGRGENISVSKAIESIKIIKEK